MEALPSKLLPQLKNMQLKLNISPLKTIFCRVMGCGDLLAEIHMTVLMLNVTRYM